MSLVAVLGSSYPLSAYTRSRSGYLQPSAVYLGGTDFFSAIGEGIQNAWATGVPDTLKAYIDGQRKASDSEATRKLWDDLLGKVLDAKSPAEVQAAIDAAKKQWYEEPTPWIIGGIAVAAIILLLTMSKKFR